MLYEKHCAVAPGIAFDTADDVQSLQRSDEELQTVDGFCRVSLASSTESVVEGIHRICDLLDSLEREREIISIASYSLLSLFIVVIFGYRGIVMHYSMHLLIRRRKHHPYIFLFFIHHQSSITIENKN